MKNESYRHILPHFQQPGQAYFITWNLKDAIPPKALFRYTQMLELLKSQIKSLSGSANSDSPVYKKSDFEIASPELERLKQEYYSVRKKYVKAYDELLDGERNPSISLSKQANTEIIINTLLFWEGKTLKNHAFTIMPNHIHWVLELLGKDEEGYPVYLQDVLQSVKRFSANQINKVEGRVGKLWQKESFETTIRDNEHLNYAISYTINNPVVAGLVKEWNKWPGTRYFNGCGDL
jgi:putative transposase